MITCKECKFWRGSGKEAYGDCSSKGFQETSATDSRTDQLIYSDYEGYMAFFDTGKDFGCIHGEPKCNE